MKGPRIYTAGGEAIRGVNCASGAKLSATGRECKVTRAVSREILPV